jgi:hypothetical protein
MQGADPRKTIVRLVTGLKETTVSRLTGLADVLQNLDRRV